MCLSKAYLNERIDDKEHVIADMISSVGYRGDKVVLTDLLSREYVYTGELYKVDLMENYIIIKTNA